MRDIMKKLNLFFSRLLTGQPTYLLGNRGVGIGCDGELVIGGFESIVVGGNSATVIGGYRSRVSGGNWATVIGGYKAIVSGGHQSTLILRHHDKTSNKWTTCVAIVGQDGIEDRVPYMLDEQGSFVKSP